MTGQAIRAGRAFVEIVADDKEFRKQMQAFSRGYLRPVAGAIRGTAAAVAGLGTAITAGLGISIKQFANFGDELDEASIRMGATTEFLSAMSLATEQAGSSLKGLEAGFRTMQRQLLAASNGSQGAQQAFSQLGLSVEELKALSPEEQFLRIADSLAGVGDSSTRAAMAMKLFGKSGTQLLPLISKGRAGIEAFKEQAQALGIILSKEDAAAAGEFNDALHNLGSSFKGVAVQLGAAIVPALTDFVNLMAHSIGAVANFISMHKELVIAGSAVVVTITAISAAVVALTFAVGIFEAVASPLLLVLVGVEALIAGVAVNLAVMTTALYTAIRGWDGLIEDIKDAFNWFKDLATFLLSGNFVLAFSLVGETIQAVLLQSFLDLFNLVTAMFPRFLQNLLAPLGDMVTKELGDVRGNIMRLSELARQDRQRFLGGGEGGRSGQFGGVDLGTESRNIRGGTFSNIGGALAFGTEAIQQRQLDQLEQITQNTGRIANGEGALAFG